MWPFWGLDVVFKLFIENKTICTVPNGHTVLFKMLITMFPFCNQFVFEHSDNVGTIEDKRIWQDTETDIYV